MRGAFFFYLQLIIFAFILITAGACEKFEYNPYQLPLTKAKEPLNELNIRRLKAREPHDDDTVRILFTGDSQRFYYSLDGLVKKANSLPKLDLLVLAGDITDFGLLKEYKWIEERLSELKVPFLCVIGNHDISPGGPKVYEAVFGARNFSCTYKGYKFIFHDTNGREYDFDGKVPDLNWLQAQISSGTPNWMIGVSHVPPYDSDFDRKLEMPYAQLLATNQRFLLSLHGHLHGYMDGYYYQDHVRYITAYSVDKNKCVLLTLVQGEINSETVSY